MADTFDQLLSSELDAVETELVRLRERRRLVEELLSLDSASPTVPTSAGRRRGRRGARRSSASTTSAASAPSARRPRLRRGLIGAKIREFLSDQREPVHATAILAYLERHDAAPRAVKPLATLQSSLQRLKETGELENTGRNHWRLRSSTDGAASVNRPTEPTEPTTPTPAMPAVLVAPGDGPPAVTSTTTLGSTPSVGQSSRA